MIPALANHLWQSSLFAAGAILLSFAFRHNAAQIRYRLWLAASLKFLVPFSLILALGSRLEWRSAAEAPPPVSTAIVGISQPFSPPASVPTPPAAPPVHFPFWPWSLALVWLGGCAAVLYRWCMQWRTVRRALRDAKPLPFAAPVIVMSSPSPLEPGIFGILRPTLLLPDGVLERLTPAQFQAILAHELCHVRRRDNLAAFLHMLVEAVFWFHPMVWWIGARLVAERERACDEEVLSQGSDPEVYAAGILNVCRFYLESPAPCAGVTGADLQQRIRDIMTEPFLHSLSLSKRILLTAAGVAALAIPLVMGIARAQTAVSPLRFEVASIKPSKSTAMRGSMQVYPGGGLRMDGATLRQFVAFAYDVREENILGGPKWISSDAYDLLAKPERSTPADSPATSVAPGTTAWDRMRLRLQTLLAERFQLLIHKDGKDASGYSLVVAKGGLKLQPSLAQEPAGTMRSMGRIDGRSGTMHMLATVLTGYLGRPVVDRTGLTENYSYKLEYAQEAPDGTSTDPSGPDVFKALQEQLGLKLEPGKVTTVTILIDRAQKPTAN